MMTNEEKVKKVNELSLGLKDLRDKIHQAIEEERYEDAAAIHNEAELKHDEMMNLMSNSLSAIRMPYFPFSL
jgi:protein-arginine kinase activator protein McsA